MLIEKQYNGLPAYGEKHNDISCFVESITGKLNNQYMSGSYINNDDKPHWFGTKSYDEAIDLLEHGDRKAAERLTLKVGSVKKQFETQGKRIKSEYSVVGHQASVPRYLQGIPQNMIMQKKVQMKQKVIKLTKCISYPWTIDTEKIFESSAKALIIVEKLEAMGYRVELDIVWAAKESYKQAIFTIITLKRASERLNISKLAFPMTNPSMLRRLAFRWLEVTDCVKYYGFSSGYGSQITDPKEIEKLVTDSYILPSFIADPQQVINDWKL